MFETNVLGVMHMCQLFFPQVLAAKGTIVNVGSVAATTPLPFLSHYCASKASLYAYSDILRLELAPLGVNVIYAMCGNIKTNIV